MRAGAAIKLRNDGAMDVEREVEADEIGVLKRPQHCEALAETVLHAIVERARIANAFSDHRDGFAPERMLKPVGDEAGHILFHMRRLFSDARQQSHRPFDGGVGCRLGLDHLHERNEIRRVPPMRAQNTLRRLQSVCDLRDRDNGGIARENGVRGRESLDLSKYRALEFQLLWDSLGHELRARDCIAKRTQSHTTAAARCRSPPMDCGNRFDARFLRSRERWSAGS